MRKSAQLANSIPDHSSVAVYESAHRLINIDFRAVFLPTSYILFEYNIYLGNNFHQQLSLIFPKLISRVGVVG
ncbi:MAG: hypothetical protein P5681_19505 [Limnospira sp. PMC 894.15]|uniref:hypothetical protein n=1 Tax=Limnospira TaxID=2596745 RepID=UPI0028E13DEE|nr:hypothetical protein [Limnospira sp. PMC 894.15]MDT9189980.1 hypothetical protein [Limnospira sp. PMC 894.15]MDY7053854.1 hypothetical protein [Limnospira fusiformis LS22]